MTAPTINSLPPQPQDIADFKAAFNITDGVAYTDAQALSAARAGIPASNLTIGQVQSAKAPAPSTTLNIGAQDPGAFLPRIKARKAALIAGTATSNIKVCHLGDSTDSAANANGNGMVNVRPLAVSNVFAALINSAQCPADADNFFGDQNVQLNGQATGTTVAQYDPQRTLGTGWSSQTGVPGTLTLGGQLVSSSSANGAPYSYLPLNLKDACDVYYAQYVGPGTFSISRTGDTTSPVYSVVGTSAMAKQTFVGALGSVNAFRINPISGVNFIAGVLTYNTAVKSVQIINCGWNGGTAVDFTNSVNGFGPLPSLKTLAPDLTIISDGINAWNQQLNITTYMAAYDALVKAALLSGDVICVTPFPSKRTYVSQIGNVTCTLEVQKQYVDAIKTVATNNNVLVLDLWSKWISFENVQPFGYYATNDSLHPLAAGYREKAVALAAIWNSL